jgi:hypothetical protein
MNRIDIQDLTRKLYTLQYVSYSTIRAFEPYVESLLDQITQLNGYNGWLNWFQNASDIAQNDIDRMKRVLDEKKKVIFDTMGHAPDDDYGDWPAFRDIWLQIAVEANAIMEASGKELDIQWNFVNDIGQGIEHLPSTVATAAAGVANVAGNVAGETVGGFFSGLGLSGWLFVGGAVLLGIYIIAPRTIARGVKGTL